MSKQEPDASKPISEGEYLGSFTPGEMRKEALKHAMDIRKFEIDLYWKRATYFWTFIGATLAGYAAVQGWSAIVPKKDFSVLLACLGLVFSFGWYCVNRGSKQWQENWENHVDMLEDDVMGPLYKTVLRRPESEGLKKLTIKELLTAPARLSVTKVNQIISVYVVVLWLFLMYKSLSPFALDAKLDWSYVVLVGITFGCCAAFLKWGGTHDGPYRHIATRRKTEIVPPKNVRKP